ncbi:MAG TPA: ABC transporter permease, partial [Polyangiaceae bacterium]|nr:ABC transporter permease [Polyangiaceae bacterium]
MRSAFAALRIAVRAIIRSKLRAFLTVLGILIGVAAVVLVVSLGASVRERVLGEIATLGANTIYIWPQSTQASGAKQNESAKLTEADGEAIAREATSIAVVTPFSGTSAQVLAGDRNATTQVMGASQSYFQVRAYTFAKGGVWTDSDELLKSKVCVIGDTVRENLFGTGDGMGQYIRIGRHPFKVIGVLTRKG